MKQKVKHNIKLSWFFLIVVLMSNSCFCVESWRAVDFDSSMQINKFKKVIVDKAIVDTEAFIGVDGYELLDCFRNIYNKNILLEPQADIKIPKIVHHIWLGSPFPDSLKPYMETWKLLHPDWTFILWTDELVKELGLYNQKIYDIESNYGAKSDIARYEILYRFGGVYVDVDFESLKSLEVLHHTYDFYAGLLPLDTEYITVGIGILGSAPRHPVLGYAIATLEDNYKNNKGAPAKTGPIHFTRACFGASVKLIDKGIIFPATHFYPFPARAIYKKDYGLSLIDRDAWKSDGAFAVHWWGKTWMPEGYRPVVFRNLGNTRSVNNWNK